MTGWLIGIEVLLIVIAIELAIVVAILAGKAGG